MENRKDIGKAFREKLDGLHKSPGDHVWQSIKQDLPKKNRWLLLPLWLRAIVIPAAALFIIGLSTYPLWQKHVPHIYLQMPEETKNKTITTKTNSPGVATSQEATPSLTKGKGSLENTADRNDEASGHAQSSFKNENAIVATSPAANTTPVHGDKSTHNRNYSRNKNANDLSLSRSYSNNSTKKPAQTRKSKIAANISDTKISIEKDTDARMTSTAAKDIAANNSNSNIKSSSQAQANNSTSIRNNHDINSNRISGTTKEDTDNVSNGPADIKQKALALNTKDSIRATTKITEAAPRADKAETEEDKKIQEEDTEYKSVYAYAFAAPTLYDTENASSIDASLAGKEIAVEKAFSYGAYLGFNVSPKISLRIGVINSALELKTNNVSLNNSYILHEPTDEQPNGWLETIGPADYSGISYATGVSNNSVMQALGNRLDERGQPVANFNIYHKLEFIEVPLEATYAIYNENFRIGLTGGFSMRFLTENKVYAQNNEGNIHIGRLSDVDKMTYGASLGAGFYYELIPSLEFNLEPVARYYFNSPKSVKPVTFGVQVGLQYNFNLSKKKNK